MFGRSACAGLGLMTLSGTVVVACSLDQRELAPLAEAGAAGFYGAGGSANEFAGAAGSVMPEPLPLCDFAAGVPAGCETLVENPGFKLDVASWKAEEGSLSMSWKAEDASASGTSGSLSVVNALFGEANGISVRGAAQCLLSLPEQNYGIAADVFIPRDQTAGITGASVATAGLSVIFYDGEHCDGFTLGNFTSELLEEPGAWVHLVGYGASPRGVKSMSVRLVTLKDFRQRRFEARFDNVLVKAN